MVELKFIEINATGGIAAIELEVSVQPSFTMYMSKDFPTDQRINALGNISGAVNINLANGVYVTADLTGTVTLSFSSLGRPAAGQMREFVLHFTTPQTINWPAGTKFTEGDKPTPEGSEYEILCCINPSGAVVVYGVLDNIST